MFYAGGTQQVTEYVSRNLQKSRLPPAFCDDASRVGDLDPDPQELHVFGPPGSGVEQTEKMLEKYNFHVKF
jgi:hypothetical protein